MKEKNEKLLFNNQFLLIKEKMNKLDKELDLKNKEDKELKKLYQLLKNEQKPIYLSERLTNEDILYIAKALLISKEIIFRNTGLVAYDSQVKAAFALYRGLLVDMKTGEGKTLAGLLCTLIQSLHEDLKTYIIAPNDYLSKRDFLFSLATYQYIELSVAHVNKNEINEKINYDKKRELYKSYVIYVDNQTLINDFISNLNAKKKEEIFMEYPKKQSNGSFKLENIAAIIDEVDSILIDDGSRFITSSKTIEANVEILKKGFEFAKQLSSDDYYKDSEIGHYHLSKEGIEKACKKFDIEKKDYFNSRYKELRKSILSSLEALLNYQRDIHYIVQEGKIIIIDSSTGRLNKTSRFTGGIHQLLEIKENLLVHDDIQAICGITHPSFYQTFTSFSGMSGTIYCESEEIENIYHKAIIEIEQNHPTQRIDHQDVICQNKKDKANKIIEQIKKCHERKQPVLCVTRNIQTGEHYLSLLLENGIQASLLSAKNNEEEATILSKAGQHGNVTIATIMAGRGVDIIPDKITEEVGGLYVIGCEKFYSSRIDNQLRGRTGRQGCKGETQFFISLDDEISSSYASKLSALSFAEQRLKPLLNNNDKGLGIRQIEKIYNDAQKNKESEDYKTRCFYMDLFSQLSNEFIYICSQKNELLESDDEKRKSIINKMMMKNKDKKHLFLTKPVSSLDTPHIDIPEDKRESFALYILEKWENFFEQDRYKQRVKLHSETLNDNFISQYLYDNKIRWKKMLQEIREYLVEEVSYEE